ncbi:hypothetical protein LNQ52_29605 [Klebsiella pneumoniae subsp. pneumoniae]|nr:hypothetical protein [Klebsiella pneumoniae subsp. pneumoniae]
MRYAITQGYIVPYYQPLVNGKTGEIYGVEILARWQNSTTPARLAHANLFRWPNVPA